MMNLILKHVVIEIIKNSKIHVTLNKETNV